ncbi:hypothetical protein [Tuwongella immobilis]|uniref:Uncharacterized protein n=1 Tax=Tuwongella immobilis TaxID=692036 RepID=A0A6C2YKB1_9BACT|nr:hypothetical protein [Tuwongella immobilis]VIP01817.1 unnamed protein product [Tuwongella immobilis]VTR99540.1 unnamed protein product [Tuwongella immobilis]
MNAEKIVRNIQQYVEHLYQKLATRPTHVGLDQRLGPLILVLEVIVDILEDDCSRANSYDTFLQHLGYGMHRFDSKFDAVNQCLIVYQSREIPESQDSSELRELYLKEFKDCWIRYLEWRKQKMMDAKAD